MNKDPSKIQLFQTNENVCHRKHWRKSINLSAKRFKTFLNEPFVLFPPKTTTGFTLSHLPKHPSNPLQNYSPSNSTPLHPPCSLLSKASSGKILVAHPRPYQNNNCIRRGWPKQRSRPHHSRLGHTAFYSTER